MQRKNKMLAATALLAAAAWAGLPAGPAAAATSPSIGTAWTWDATAGDTSAASGAPSTDRSADTAGADGQAVASSAVERVIAEGMQYLGTPYEYGSDRSTDKTFDCSDFVKWIFGRAADVTLPSDSEAQGRYVKEKGAVVSDWRQLQRGDLMFFMSYHGASSSAYNASAKADAAITHVALYLGNGQMLQTYSQDSGGVRIDTIDGTTWEKRFLFGGSAL